MTVSIANVNTTNTFDYWRNITNQIASAMSNVVVTVGSTTTGNASVNGNIFASNVTIGNSTSNISITNLSLSINAISANYETIANTLTLGNSSVNSVHTATSIAITNSTANINISIPTAAQIANGQYTLNANGSWSTPSYLNVNNSISVGNASVNLVINSTSISIGNSSVNSVHNTSSIAISNSTANINISIPTATQISNGQYYLNANGTWDPIVIIGTVSTNTVSVSSSPTLIDSWLMSNYVSADYTINVNDNVNNNHSTTKILMMHNTANALITEYGQLVSNTFIGTFTANASSGYTQLYFTPNTGFTSMTVKFARVLF